MTVHLVLLVLSERAFQCLNRLQVVLNLISGENESPHLVQSLEDIHCDKPLVIVAKDILVEAYLSWGVLWPERFRLLSLSAKILSPSLELLKQALRFLYLSTVSLAKKRCILLWNLPCHHHSHGLLSLALVRVLGPDFGHQYICVCWLLAPLWRAVFCGMLLLRALLLCSSLFLKNKEP